MPKHDKRGRSNRLPPFVPILTATMDTPAWRAMSAGAKVLYLHLKRRVPKGHNEAWLPRRQAQAELGSGATQISRWYRELAHFGFIVMTTPGCLGVEGKGRSPHWRLTELGSERAHTADGSLKLPSKDFLRWDGRRFSEPDKKQNPGPESRTTPVQKAGPLVVQKSGPPIPRSGPEIGTMEAGDPGPEIGTITSIPLPTGQRGPRDETPAEKEARRREAAKRGSSRRLNWHSTGQAPKPKPPPIGHNAGPPLAED